MAMATVGTRQVSYALVSFLLGVWTFIKVNEISGPAFEPILAACQNPEISAAEFASKTGYHEYDSRVGLGVFNLLVCLITQFLVELRDTYPAGLLVWCGVVVVAFPFMFLSTIESGRAGARGPIRYPVTIGILGQLFGISVTVPMIWIPSFIMGEGTRGSPVTSFRVFTAAVLALPAMVLTLIVFLAPTDSPLWTTSAGMLGGPILAMCGLVLFSDGSSSLTATEESAKNCSRNIQNVYKIFMPVGLVTWYILVAVAYQNYGLSIGNLWRGIWVDANASVAFMTIDTIVLHLAIILYIAYRSDEFKAVKALMLTFILGPAVANLLVLVEIERETKFDFVEKQLETKKET